MAYRYKYAHTLDRPILNSVPMYTRLCNSFYLKLSWTNINNDMFSSLCCYVNIVYAVRLYLCQNYLFNYLFTFELRPMLSLGLTCISRSGENVL